MIGRLRFFRSVAVTSFQTTLVMLLLVTRHCECQTTHVTIAEVASRATFITPSSRGLAPDVAPSAASLAPTEGEKCRLTTRDPYVSHVVKRMLRAGSTLIQYRLNFTNYTTNPLLTPDIKAAFRPDRWSRVTSSHGQTLLSLAFNHGYLSMSTLTLGTAVLDIELVDRPAGCFGTSSETSKIELVQDLLMRDFNKDATFNSTSSDEKRVCHEIVLDRNGYGLFRHNCCYVSSINNQIKCTSDIGNFWLSLLNVMQTVVRYSLLLFSPVMFMSHVMSMSKESVPYVVCLKEKLKKSVVFCKSKPDYAKYNYKQQWDLRKVTDGFPKFFRSVEELEKQGKLNRKVEVAFGKYDLAVDHNRTLCENTVPVGLFQTLFRTFFKCHIRYIGPFRDCCAANMFTLPRLLQHPECTNRWLSDVTWITFFQQLAKVLLAVLIPVPFYIRLMLFYIFEQDEVNDRQAALTVRGLHEQYENSALLYFTPSHSFFISMYIVYVVAATSLAFWSSDDDGKFPIKSIIIKSFRDLKTLDWTHVVSTAVSNMIWPLKQFGVCGCLIGLIYWPIAAVLSTLIGFAYLLPTIYLSFRMVYHAWDGVIVKKRVSKRQRYQVRYRTDRNVHKLRAERCFGKRKEETKRDVENTGSDQGKGDNRSPLPLPHPQGGKVKQLIDVDVDEIEIKHFKKQQDAHCSSSPNVAIESNNGGNSEIRRYDEEGGQDTQSTKSYDLLHEYTTYCTWPKISANIAAVSLAIVTLYTCVVILSEVLGSVVEIVTFTIMGVIVNAGALLRYAMLLLMVFVYCCDCFNNVTKKYLKLNSALFNEIRSRITKELEAETSLPAHLQENRGFKAQELNQQAEHEMPDDIAADVDRHWMINDLVMFVDNEDMPRIPRKLFEMVCDMRVAGVPGPIYRGHIEAVTQLIKIILFVCFVFVVVLSFGAVYRVSTTNQMLAALFGGFLPMILRKFFAPPAPDIELGTVSFRSKMDEIIKNFCQYWPIHDLPFEQVAQEQRNSNTQENSDSVPLHGNEINSTPENNDVNKHEGGALTSRDKLAGNSTSAHATVDVDLLVLYTPRHDKAVELKNV